MKPRITLLLTLLCFALTLTAQVKVKVKRLASPANTYQVLINPSITVNAPMNQVPSANLVVQTPTGTFAIGAVTNVKGVWSNYQTVRAPAEDPAHDYFLFNLTAPTNQISIQNGVDEALFNFVNTGGNVSEVKIFSGQFNTTVQGVTVSIGNQMVILGNGLSNAISGVGGSVCNFPSQTDDCGGNAIKVSINKTPPSACGIADGRIEFVTLTNTTGLPLEFSITGNGINANYQSSATFNNLPSGTIYECVARTLAAICTNEVGDVEIDGPLAAIPQDPDITHPDCGQANGVITLHAVSSNGGVLNYRLGNTGAYQASATFSGLAAGTYEFWVRDVTNNCENLLGAWTLDDCPVEPCLITYDIENLGNGRYQVSMTPDTTWNFPNNITGSIVVNIRVPTGGFVLSNLTSQVTGVTFAQGGNPYVAPVENPNYDYYSISFGGSTQNVPYIKGNKVPLFTFDNTGNCVSGLISLVEDTDPFAANPNVSLDQITTVSGYPDGDLIACLGAIEVNCETVPPPTPSCLITYELEKLANGKFQINMTPDTTWTAPVNNITGGLTVAIRVPAGGFVVSSLTSLVSGVTFAANPMSVSPPQNPAYDYFTIFMQNASTQAIPYVKGQEVPLFNFENSGPCTGLTVSLVEDTDPIHNNNNISVEQYIAVSGSGGEEIDICLISQPADDCGGCNVTAGFSANDACLGTATTFTNTSTSAETITSWNWNFGDNTSSNLQSPSHSYSSSGNFEVSLTVTTESGCEATFTDNVTVFSSPGTVSQNAYSICNGDAVTILAPSGAGISVTWSPQTGLSDPNISNPSANPAATTVYTWTATNGDGCQTTGNITVTVANKPVIAGVTGTNQSDCGVQDGSITVNASGVGAIEYSLDGTTYQSSPSFSNLAPGSYTVFVRNADDSCPVAFNGNPVTLTAPSSPAITNISTTQPTCSTGGSITISASGGNGPLQYSINGGTTFQASNTFTNLPAGNYTPVVANANGSCDLTGSVVTLNQPAGATITPVDNINVCVAATATVTLTLSENIQSFDINGAGFTNPVSNGNTLTFQVIGVNSVQNYSVQMVGIGGCSDTEDFTVTGIPIPTATFTASTPACTSGQVQVTLNYTGNASQQASLNWAHSGATVVFPNPATNSDETRVLAYATPGQKTISLDVNDQGCQANFSTNITVTTFNPGATATATNVTACGGSNGAVDLSVGPGTFTYLWNNGVTQQDLSNVAGGTYTVTITESGTGCTATTSATVTAPQAVSIVNVSSNPATDCSGSAANGSITVNANGGGASLQYNLYSTSNLNQVIDQINSSQSSVTFTGLAAGGYQVEVLGSGNCSDIETTAVTATGSTLSVTTASVQGADCGENNGSFTLNLSGAAPYTYTLFENNNIISSNQPVNGSTLNVGSLEAASYVLIINDNNGCVAPHVVQIESLPASIQVTSQLTNPTCNATNGGIDLTLPAGATFNWCCGLSPTADQTNLQAGVYSVTVTATNGCSQTFNYQLSPTDGPQVTVSNQINAPCGSTDGSITFTVANPNAFSYQILNTNIPVGFGNPNQSITINGLQAGAYVIQIEDLVSPFCETVEAFVIEGSTNMPSVISEITAPSACGISDASICLTVTGGAAPYTITSDEGDAPDNPVQAEGCIQGLYDGTVLVTITDASGCTVEYSQALPDQPEPIDLTISDLVVTNYDCPGEFGSIIATNQSLVYNIFNPATSQIFATPWNQATAGDYLVSYSEGACTDTIGVSVGGPDDWDVQSLVTGVSCDGADGSINLTVGGANGNYTYIWSNGADTSLLENLDAGVYDVTITDGIACTTTASFTVLLDCIDEPCEPVFLRDTFIVELQPGLTEVCLPTNVPSLSPFHLDLNTQPYEEDVNECVDLVYFYNANFDNPPYKMTEWTYRGNKVTDFNFTNASELVAFMNSLDPIGNWSLSEDENRIIGGAPGSIYGKIQVEYSGNMTEELLANTLSVSHPSIFVGNVPSAHIFVVTEQQSGCQDTLYINLLSLDTLEQNQDTITVILPVGEVDTICLSLEELPGLPELISNQCFSTYNAQVQATGSDPCVIVTGLQPGDDQACLVLCDNLGKCDTTILLIEVRDTSTELIIFNGFSPNEDGVNDFFRIKNIELYPNNTLKIFNRWGNTVFETTGYRNYWDAIYKNTYLPDGTYFYFLEVEINGVMKTFSGFVEVRK